jgi:hypothetical protein
MTTARFFALCIAAVLILCVPVPVHAQEIAVLRFAVVPTGLDDEVVPSAADAAQLTGDLRHAVAARTHAAIVVIPHPCLDRACALAAGRRVHADSVVFGQVTRYMAVLWTMSVERLDVKTGRLRTTPDNLYKGDFLALEHAMGPVVRQLGI